MEDDDLLLKSKRGFNNLQKIVCRLELRITFPVWISMQQVIVSRHIAPR
jgi:hypothetical protein